VTAQAAFAATVLVLSGGAVARAAVGSFRERRIGSGLWRSCGALAAFALAGLTLHLERLAASAVPTAPLSKAELILRAVAILLFLVHVLAATTSAIPLVFAAAERAGFVPLVAVRHVRSPRTGFLRVISFLAMAGIGVATAALATVISVMGGFSADLRGKIIGSNPHVLFDRPSQEPFELPRALLEALRADVGVAGATATLRFEAMASSPSNLGGVVIHGVDPAEIAQVLDVPNLVEAGRFDYLERPDELLSLPADAIVGVGPAGEAIVKGPGFDGLEGMDPAVREALRMPADRRPGIVVGRELARTLHVMVGDELAIVAPMGDLSPVGVMPRTRKFRVAAIFYSGMYEYDATHVYARVADVAEPFEAVGKVGGLEVRLRDPDASEAFVAAWLPRAAELGLDARDWRMLNKNLFTALRLERGATFVVLSLAVVVASFCILCTLLLLVSEKTGEIAVLKAIGATDADIVRIFLGEGLVLGGVGVLLGSAASLALCLGLRWFGLRLDPEVYYLDKLPVTVNPLDFLAVVGAALVICAAATFWPARAASRLRPVEGLRYE
jgi:lipoprotein-releasing system permease protein